MIILRRSLTFKFDLRSTSLFINKIHIHTLNISNHEFRCKFILELALTNTGPIFFFGMSFINIFILLFVV